VVDDAAEGDRRPRGDSGRPARERTLAPWRGRGPAARRRTLACVLLAICLAGLALAWAWRRHRQAGPEPGVTLGNFRRLHGGMTEAQVGEILGPGEEAGGRLRRVVRYAGDGCEVEILFHGGGALAGQWTARLRREGMTRAQVEAILDGGGSAGGRRWRWQRVPGGSLASDDGEFLCDTESAVTGHLTGRGCWLREEMRRKPPEQPPLLEWVQGLAD
jgi:hypothetical protein